MQKKFWSDKKVQGVLVVAHADEGVDDLGVGPTAPFTPPAGGRLGVRVHDERNPLGRRCGRQMDGEGGFAGAALLADDRDCSHVGLLTGGHVNRRSGSRQGERQGVVGDRSFGHKRDASDWPPSTHGGQLEGPFASAPWV